MHYFNIFFSFGFRCFSWANFHQKWNKFVSNILGQKNILTKIQLTNNFKPIFYVAVFSQVVSRVIACTIFTVRYTWRIFIVLVVHFLLVLLLKVGVFVSLDKILLNWKDRWLSRHCFVIWTIHAYMHAVVNDLVEFCKILHRCWLGYFPEAVKRNSSICPKWKKVFEYLSI